MKPKARILIVDDEAPMRLVLQQVLIADGYEVETAANGTDALELAAREQFDLMMIDLIMPGKDGFQTILSLREDLPRMRIIAMSGGGGYRSSNYLRFAGKIGDCQTLAKPFSKQAMLDAIETELAVRKDDDG